MNRPNFKKQKENFDYLIKILLIGDSAVGKTNTMLRYCDSGYKPVHMITVGVDFKMKTIKVDQIQLKLQIWDTAGQEKYQTMAQSYYNGASAVIVVYSITDRNSFLNVRNWIKQISEHASDPIITLVGNKCDESENQRKVDKAEGQQLADEYKILFFEASAKDNINITQLFEETARQIKDKQLNSNLFGDNSSQKIKLDANHQIGSLFPNQNDTFKLTGGRKQSKESCDDITTFDQSQPNTQNQINNCQC